MSIKTFQLKKSDLFLRAKLIPAVGSAVGADDKNAFAFFRFLFSAEGTFVNNRVAAFVSVQKFQPASVFVDSSHELLRFEFFSGGFAVLFPVKHVAGDVVVGRSDGKVEIDLRRVGAERLAVGVARVLFADADAVGKGE